MHGLERITSTSDILGGKPCIRGMRIAVSLIVNLVANGMTTAEIIDEYPGLEPEDMRQALLYAAWVVDGATTDSEPAPYLTHGMLRTGSQSPTDEELQASYVGYLMDKYQVNTG